MFHEFLQYFKTRSTSRRNRHSQFGNVQKGGEDNGSMEKPQG